MVELGWKVLYSIWVFREGRCGVNEGRKRALGECHPGTLSSLRNISSMQSDNGDYKTELRLYDYCCEKQKSALSEIHPDTLSTIDNMANGYDYKGGFDKAL